MTKKAYIIDGNSVLFRSYYATAYSGNIMRNKDGIPTNAIYTFHNYMKKFKQDLTYFDYLIVCFDTGKKSFRHEQYENYKAQRKPVDEDLKIQMPIAREMLDAMNIFHLEIEGYEGDDLAGSFASMFANLGIEVTLFTSDKDFLQLVKKNIDVTLIKSGFNNFENNNVDNFYDHYGLTPKQIVDYKAIAGDSSDNYKGVKGVGDKTTIPLLQKYETLDNIYDHLDDLSKSNREKFIQYKNDCFLCRELAEIKTDIDLKEYLSQTNNNPYDEAKLIEFYNKYQFNSFLKQLNSNLNTSPKEASSITLEQAKNNIDLEAKLKQTIVTNELENSFKTINSLKELKYIPDTFSFVMPKLDSNENLDEICGLVLSDKYNATFIPSIYLMNNEEEKDLLIKTLSRVTNTYDLKKQLVILSRFGLNLDLNISFDLLLSEYILKSNDASHTEKLNSYEDIISKTSYLCCYISQNKEIFINKLKEQKEYDLLVNIEQPLSKVLAKMEIEGVYADVKFLNDIKQDYMIIATKLKSKVLSYSKDPNLNLNSPKQMTQFLFEELGLGKSIKKKSTSIEVLKYLLPEHEVIPYLITYRKYNKIITTYLESLPKYISRTDGKIHACFNQALTQTGRLSSSEPNLQNISVKDDVGKEIRKAFYVDNNHTLLSLDYSQIELRMLADLANIPALINSFNNDEDIHTLTASKIFKVNLENVTPTMRKQAKGVNFGIIYGITTHGLATDLGIPYTQAKDFIDSFNNEFPEISKFQEETINFAKEHGYVQTITNRIRYLDDINSKNFQLRAFSERAAVNTVIQGSAADLIKIAMVNIDKFLTTNNYKTKMILQIHDELIFKVPNEELEIMQIELKSLMENAIIRKVKFKVEQEKGRTWYEL